MTEERSVNEIDGIDTLMKTMKAAIDGGKLRNIIVLLAEDEDKSDMVRHTVLTDINAPLSLVQTMLRNALQHIIEEKVNRLSEDVSAV